MKPRLRKILAAIAVVAVLLLGAGVRIRTQAGWRIVSTNGLAPTKQGGEAALRLTLFDTRDQRRRDYRWDFVRVGDVPPSVEIDCGEFKRVLIWKADIGISFDGRRFKRKIALDERGSGADGVFRYEFAWLTKSAQL
jgi:hypothetical protein